MWCAAFLLLAASLSVSLARPHLHPLSSEMVNYINKINTTWKVSGVFSTPVTSVSVDISHSVFLTLPPSPQAGHNFRDVDYSYVQKLCGTMLKGPKLPVM